MFASNSLPLGLLLVVKADACGAIRFRTQELEKKLRTDSRSGTYAVIAVTAGRAKLTRSLSVSIAASAKPNGITMATSGLRA
ncbi:hypothetical protein AAVH_14798 [Aphelenchoides avenae]|nr:hypothetical protein AAVH_14798 [Aphelenchus avenae]